MKNLKMPIAAIALLSIVTGALGFKSAHRNLGNIYCAATTTTVSTLAGCSGQSGLIYQSTIAIGGSNPSPCNPTTQNTYDGSNSSECNLVSGNVFQTVAF